MLLCGYVAMFLYRYVAMLLYRYVAISLCCYIAISLCCSFAISPYRYVALLLYRLIAAAFSLRHRFREWVFFFLGVSEFLLFIDFFPWSMDLIVCVSSRSFLNCFMNFCVRLWMRPIFIARVPFITSSVFIPFFASISNVRFPNDELKEVDFYFLSSSVFFLFKYFSLGAKMSTETENDYFLC
jgi:hypothetical protein